MAKYLNQDIGHVLLPQLKKNSQEMARHSMLLTCSHLRIGEYSPLVDSALPENRQMAAEYMLTITDCWRPGEG